MNNKRWTEEEINILKENYKTLFYKDIAKMIKRTPDAIKIKARELKLKKDRTLSKMWSKEDDKFLINNYSKIKIDNIVSILNKNRTAIKSRASRIGLLGNPRTLIINRRKLNFNEYYFSEPNINNCYWAGFIAADGCISNNIVIDISLSIKDKTILENFKKEICFDGKIREYLGKSELCGDFWKCSIAIRSKIIADDLAKWWNISPRKSFTLDKPSEKITGELAYSYIKGIFDGDGYITKLKYNDYKYLILGICGTKEILEWIDYNLKLKFPSLYCQINKHSSIYKLVIANKMSKEVHKFLRYNINNHFSLPRKWEIDYSDYR